jgi:hypothetical protein
VLPRVVASSGDVLGTMLTREWGAIARGSELTVRT